MKVRIKIRDHSEGNRTRKFYYVWISPHSLRKITWFSSVCGSLSIDRGHVENEASS